MIAACPKCSARYRIDEGRLRPEGARLRCSKCEAVFRVRAPAPVDSPAAAPNANVTGPSDAAGEDRRHAPADTGRGDAAPAPAAESESGVCVLVADPLIEEGKATANTLASWGVRPILVHDGVEAILTIQRTLPAAVIIDAALPKMYGFQVCELLKRNESLRHIHVILIGAIHDRHRYRRDPTDLYGADAYLERPQLPEALWPMLRGFGLPIGIQRESAEPAPAAAPPAPDLTAPAVEVPSPATPPSEAPPEVRESRPVPAAPETAPPAAPPPSAPPSTGESGLDAEIAKAERLARIVVSDIVLYNQEKFDAAVQRGDVVEAMRADLEEGRALFSQRIDARVRESRDFLTDELVRVAGTRRSP